MTIKEAAKKYIRAGFSILPTKKDKSPAVSKWIGVELSESEFTTAIGIGVKCGKASHNLECLDFDNHFGDAKQILSDFINQGQVKAIYEKYKLPIESTLNGGFHLLIRCSTIQGNQKLASRAKKDESTGKWRPDAIIETRGEGGYFVAAPSEGYQVVRNDIFEVQEIEPSERQILIETAKSFNQWAEPKKNEFEDNNRPGDYYNNRHESIDEMKSSLLRAGWIELNKNQWRRPGKKEGISATVGKVADNVFYCFTSNGHPFNENSGYTPFQVVCLLDYNGDFKRFAKELSERYNLNEYQNNKVPYVKKEIPRKSDNELLSILEKNIIDVRIPIEHPPVILEINHGDRFVSSYKRLLTLGNMSSITGKGKSKKTFLSSMLLADLSVNGTIDDKFKACLPEKKQSIIQIDTEQSDYDTYMVAKKIHYMAGGYQQQLATINLREFSPIDRVDVILKAIDFWKEYTCFVLIDGIADLINNINDVEEAVKVTTMLMSWTKKYQTHICNVIHQNKNDNFATGHLGSALIKKSEVVIGVEKDPDNKNQSIVSCQYIRGAMEFDDFAFYLNDEILPKINWDYQTNRRSLNS